MTRSTWLVGGVRAGNARPESVVSTDEKHTTSGAPPGAARIADHGLNLGST
ncbi:hypothetical protein [Caulobacter sp. Root487D2Y]|uniref:hypothetical protein n=1 Tax=Caulobacter sp. Root487D2Y TaxID=1736547 RepID=UPI0012E35FCB|nr:hypothetical protein [Caulobacter sp. Root487D2Y]